MCAPVFLSDRVTIPQSPAVTAPLLEEPALREAFFGGIRILRFAQNDIGLLLRAFAEGVAIRFSVFTER